MNIFVKPIKTLKQVGLYKLKYCISDHFLKMNYEYLLNQITTNVNNLLLTSADKLPKITLTSYYALIDGFIHFNI